MFDSKATAISAIARKNWSVETLEERGRDRLDFADCHVALIQRALNEAFLSGRANGSMRLDAADAAEIRSIASLHLLLASFEERGRDDADFSEYHVSRLSAALGAAWEAGARQR